MRLKYLVVPAFAALLTACGSDDHQSHVVHQTGPLYYVASLHATEGNEDVHGYVTFQPTAGGVDVLAHVDRRDDLAGEAERAGAGRFLELRVPELGVASRRLEHVCPRAGRVVGDAVRGRLVETPLVALLLPDLLGARTTIRLDR